MRKIDYKAYRESGGESILNYWDDSLGDIENISSIISRALLLPEPDIQLPIITSYALLPSGLLKRIGILYILGKPGSGKSSALCLLQAIQKAEILGASQTTFSGLRNYINSNRWWNPEILEGERNMMCLLDNINADTFSDQALLGMFLNGYDRRTDSCQISKGDGSNLLFRTFCPKAISTIHPLHNDVRLTELKRRLLPIKFVSLDTLISDGELAKVPDNFLNLETIDLGYLHKVFCDFWEDEINILEFLRIRDKHARRPNNLSQEHWSVSADLIYVGLTLGVWETFSQAVQGIAEYWDYAERVIYCQESAINSLLQAYIRQSCRFFEEDEQKYLDCADLKRQVEVWAKDGKLEDSFRQGKLVESMKNLGWIQGTFRPPTEKHADIYWLPIE